jgi:ATP-dependent DNA helicase RecG
MYYDEFESSILEFKRELPGNDQIIKTIIGFCNQNGGKLILGIDNSRKIIGLKEEDLNKAFEFLDKTIFESTHPPIIPKIYSQFVNNKSILIIEVASGMNKPYFRKSEGLKKGTYIRLGRNTLRATDDLIKELQWKAKGIDFEQMPVYRANKDDLNYKEFEKFLLSKKNKAKIKNLDLILSSYHIITIEQSNFYLTIAGILLFGKSVQNFFSEAMIICSHFKGISGREAIASIDCENNLFNQFEQAYNFIISRLNKSFKIDGVKRKEQLEIPEIAIREALLNAIVHRNYHIKSPIKIAIYNNRIEIFSPGQFPGPLNVNELTFGITYLRNPAICKIFRESNYIEKLGTGFIAIFDSYEEYNLITPSIIEGENYIKCILPREKKEKKIKKVNDKSKLMNLFDKYKEITIKDVMRELTLSKSSATRIVNKMISSKKIKKIGHAKASRYEKI